MTTGNLIEPSDRPSPQRLELRSFLVSFALHAAMALVLWMIIDSRFPAESVSLVLSPDPGPAEAAFEVASKDSAAAAPPVVTAEASQPVDAWSSSRAAFNVPSNSLKKRFEPASVEFFGARAYGTRFVFLLDISYSMDARGGARYQRACDELVRSLSQLSDDQRYYVFLFCWETYEMFFGESEDYVRPSSGHEQRISDWVRDASLGAGTDPRRALAMAHLMKPDAVFLLSDGQFNRPRPALSGTGWLEDVGVSADANVQHGVEQVFPNLPIHTIAFENPFTVDDMRLIADATGGSCHYVKTQSHHPTDAEKFRRALSSISDTRGESDGKREPSAAEISARLYAARQLMSEGEFAYAEYLLRPLSEVELASSQGTLLRSLREILDDELGDIRLEDFQSVEEIGGTAVNLARSD